MMDFSADQRAAILNLARELIREALRGSPRALPWEPAPLFREPAGCFVSLHSIGGRRLRGCVGRIDATQPLIEALKSAARHVLEDPRFTADPVCLHELPDLELEVSVLSPARPAEHPLDFDPLRHGIYLTFGGRTGCFLPQVARETGWTKEQLLERLCVEKLGLPAIAWRHPQARLHVFSVAVVGPEPFEARGGT